MHSSRMRTAHLLPVSPSMHCAGGGGVCSKGGVCSREVSALGGLLWGCVCSQGVSAPGVSAPGWSAPRGGICSGDVCSWGVCSQGGCVSQHALRQTTPCEQNDWQTGVKTSPSQTSPCHWDHLTDMYDFIPLNYLQISQIFLNKLKYKKTPILKTSVRNYWYHRVRHRSMMFLQADKGISSSYYTNWNITIRDPRTVCSAHFWCLQCHTFPSDLSWQVLINNSTFICASNDFWRI